MEFALTAMTFGLAAGLKPGPLGIFIIHQTMSKGNRHGMAASLVPFITDGPIILFSFLLTSQLKDIHGFISAISVVGGIYLGTIAYKIFRYPNNITPKGKNDRSVGLFTAIKINFLNPSPYIFWLTIGIGYISMGTTAEATIFVVTALTSLCITKFTLAWLMRSLGNQFNPVIYAGLLRSLSLPLCVFGFQLVYNGVAALAWGSP